MQLPASALAASKITLKSGAAAPSTIYALHSYPLKVAGHKSHSGIPATKTSPPSARPRANPKPVAPGQVKITAKSTNTGKAVATKTFKVLLCATDVSVSPSELTLSVGETATLAATLTPSNSTDVVRFYSDDKDIATVGLSSGKVTGKKAGETTITVYAKATKATANSSKYNKVAKVKVTVTKAKPVPTPTPNLTGVFGGLRASVSTTAATMLNEGESFSVDITPADKAGNPMSMGDMTVNPRLVVGGNATLKTGSFNVNETSPAAALPSASFRRQRAIESM
ncbi:MAG: Ig-like domain-containing protein [Christensenellales bacterium]